jgi:hypothetical protein
LHWARVRAIALIYENGKKIRIEVNEGDAIDFWAALWPRSEIDRLVEEADKRGVLVNANW